MSPILPIHIAAGSVGIITGTIALFTLKGGMLHRRIGLAFVIAMIVMAATAAMISLGPVNPGNILQGLLTIYMVVTALVTVRPRTERSRQVEVGAFVLAAVIAATHLTLGAVTLNSAAGHIGGYTPPMFFVFGSVALLSALGDVRMLRAAELRGPKRLTRHLWRMCFALFLATASFFLGQADEFPESLRIWPVLAVLGLFPLVVMLYWVWRVRVRRSLRGLIEGKLQPRSSDASASRRPGTAIAVAVALAVTAAPGGAQCIPAVQRHVDALRWEDARGAATSHAAARPGEAAAHACVGRIALALDATADAVTAYERALEIEPRSAELHFRLGEALALEAARSRSPISQIRLARRVKSSFEQAIRLDARQIDARVWLVMFHSMAPRLMGGNRSQARQYVGEIARLNPMRGHMSAATIAEQEEDTVAAERAYLAAVAAAPTDSTAAHLALGEFYELRKRWTEAFALYDRLLAGANPDVAARESYGRAAARSARNLERGERELRLWLANRPAGTGVAATAAVQYSLGRILQQRGRTDEASTAYREALRLNPRHREARTALEALD